MNKFFFVICLFWLTCYGLEIYTFPPFLLSLTKHSMRLGVIKGMT